jgi:hypothetical protein
MKTYNATALRIPYNQCPWASVMTHAKGQPQNCDQQKNDHQRPQDVVIDQKTEADRRKDGHQRGKSKAAQRCKERATNANFVQVTFPESVWCYVILFGHYFISSSSLMVAAFPIDIVRLVNRRKNVEPQ